MRALDAIPRLRLAPRALVAALPAIAICGAVGMAGSFLAGCASQPLPPIDPSQIPGQVSRPYAGEPYYLVQPPGPPPAPASERVPVAGPAESSDPEALRSDEIRAQLAGLEAMAIGLRANASPSPRELLDLRRAVADLGGLLPERRSLNAATEELSSTVDRLRTAEGPARERLVGRLLAVLDLIRIDLDSGHLSPAVRLRPVRGAAILRPVSSVEHSALPRRSEQSCSALRRVALGLTVFGATLAGCAGGTPAVSGPPELTLGTGYTSFVPVEDDDAVPIVHGTQGGYHIWGALRARDLDPVAIHLRFTLGLDGESETFSTRDDVEDLDPEGATGADVHLGTAVFLPDVGAVRGHPCRWRLEVVDRAGRTASTDRRIVPTGGT